MSIVIVSNTRAEHGPLESVIKALPEAKVIGFSTDTEFRPEFVMSAAIPYFCMRFKEHDGVLPKLVVLLGDRYETLAAALAATFLRIPIAHIHGGETTTGAFDDAFRHSITHMAEQSGGLHFVATESARTRVAQLRGTLYHDYADEYLDDRSMFLVGAPGLDGIERNSAKRDHKLILITYHSETMAHDRGVGSCESMLAALPRHFLGYSLIFTGINSDPGSQDIRNKIITWLRSHGGLLRDDLTRAAFIDLMQHAALVVGNSSSGVIEAPWVGVPSINIGYRQQGREMADSVYQSAANCADLDSVIKMALSHSGPCNPIYLGGAAERIAAVCREFAA